jgi:antagonist of KipI
MTLRVLDPGLYTQVVDFGRPHCRSLGVPVGGAADRTSLAIGNALVGNPPDAAALEITLAGPTLEAACELACVFYGPPFKLESDRQALRVGKTFTLTPGERLHIDSTHWGMRGYLCVAGGLRTPTVLGSHSGFAPLRAGEELPCSPGRIHRRRADLDWDWKRHMGPERGIAAQILRVLDGPQADWFPEMVLPTFDSLEAYARGWKDGPFTVSRSSNRMGMRLEGHPIPVPDRELVSEPVCPGAVQVTRDGQCIILGVDGQTIGGYPKIAQVISADLDVVGQRRPGERLCLVRVSLAEAERVYREEQAATRALVSRLQTSLGAFPSLARPDVPHTKNHEPTDQPRG